MLNIVVLLLFYCYCCIVSLYLIVIIPIYLIYYALGGMIHAPALSVVLPICLHFTRLPFSWWNRRGLPWLMAALNPWLPQSNSIEDNQPQLPLWPVWLWILCAQHAPHKSPTVSTALVIGAMKHSTVLLPSQQHPKSTAASTKRKNHPEIPMVWKTWNKEQTCKSDK